MPTFDQLKAEYANLWSTMTVRPEKRAAVDAIARKLIASKDTYEAVEDETGVPWFVIAALHERESDADFSTYLGNGQPLNRVTTIGPKGRGPFTTWEEGAKDALEYDGLDQVDDWSPERACFEIEKFNGFGYRNRRVPSPYLWSFTNHYGGGKYVRDGVYSPSAVDKQAGAIPVLRRVMELDGATLAGSTPPQPTGASKPKSLWQLILDLIRLLLETIVGCQAPPLPAPGGPRDGAPHLTVMRSITGIK